MTYDPHAEPPRSVEYQRQIEGTVARILEWFTLPRTLAFVVVMFVVDYVSRNGVSSTADSASSGTGDAVGAFLEAITLVDVAWLVGFFVAMMVILALHELCHLAAFRYFGIEAFWSYTWWRIRGYRVLPVGGLCWPRHEMASVELTYWEDVAVSLAPLALTAVALIPTLAWHVFVDPFSALGVVVFAVIIGTGPSPPDWLALLNTPRERWERLVEFVDAQEPHRAAEGYHV